MSYCGCGYPYSYYSPYPYYGYPLYMAYAPYSYYPSYGLPLGYVYSCGPFTFGYPRGEQRVGNCLMICQ